jgi:hypothetical protein
MTQLSKIGKVFKDKLAMKYAPIGFYYTDKKPDDTIGFKKNGGGCIMPLIFASAKGRIVAFDENSMGWNCSAFYLGYRDWIFNGIENFLSNVDIPGRECERFVKTPEQAKKYVESFRFKVKSKGAAIFKPLEKFDKNEIPEVVIFFANPDQISALVFLLYYNAPEEFDRVISRFASGCGSVATIPLQLARRNEKKAVLGLNDLSARTRLPKELMTFALPYNLLLEMYNNIEESFLITGTWEKISNRCKDLS